jgi:L-asparaginase
MKKVLVINTGGTIGMQATQHGYAPAVGYLTHEPPKLLKPYGDDLPQIAILEYTPLMDSAYLLILAF